MDSGRGVVVAMFATCWEGYHRTLIVNCISSEKSRIGIAHEAWPCHLFTCVLHAEVAVD